MDFQRELTYLKELTAKHGHYLRQYFGFTLKEVALKTGLSPKMFLMILHGQKKIPEKYQERFLQVFKEMDIENRTKDFKPTESQLSTRSLREKIRLDRFAIFVTILTMVTCQEYINYVVGNSRRLVKFFKRAFEKKSNAFCFLGNLIKNNLGLKLNYQKLGFFVL